MYPTLNRSLACQSIGRYALRTLWFRFWHCNSRFFGGFHLGIPGTLGLNTTCEREGYPTARVARGYF